MIANKNDLKNERDSIVWNIKLILFVLVSMAVTGLSIIFRSSNDSQDITMHNEIDIQVVYILYSCILVMLTESQSMQLSNGLLGLWKLKAGIPLVAVVAPPAAAAAPVPAPVAAASASAAAAAPVPAPVAAASASAAAAAPAVSGPGAASAAVSIVFPTLKDTSINRLKSIADVYSIKSTKIVPDMKHTRATSKIIEVLEKHKDKLNEHDKEILDIKTWLSKDTGTNLTDVLDTYCKDFIKETDLAGLKTDIQGFNAIKADIERVIQSTAAIEEAFKDGGKVDKEKIKNFFGELKNKLGEDLSHYAKFEKETGEKIVQLELQEQRIAIFEKLFLQSSGTELDDVGKNELIEDLRSFIQNKDLVKHIKSKIFKNTTGIADGSSIEGLLDEIKEKTIQIADDAFRKQLADMLDDETKRKNLEQALTEISGGTVVLSKIAPPPSASVTSIPTGAPPGLTRDDVNAIIKQFKEENKIEDLREYVFGPGREKVANEESLFTKISKMLTTLEEIKPSGSTDKIDTIQNIVKSIENIKNQQTVPEHVKKHIKEEIEKVQKKMFEIDDDEFRDKLKDMLTDSVKRGLILQKLEQMTGPVSLPVAPTSATVSEDEIKRILNKVEEKHKIDEFRKIVLGDPPDTTSTSESLANQIIQIQTKIKTILPDDKSVTATIPEILKRIEKLESATDVPKTTKEHVASGITNLKTQILEIQDADFKAKLESMLKNKTERDNLMKAFTNISEGKFALPAAGAAAVATVVPPAISADNVNKIIQELEKKHKIDEFKKYVLGDAMPMEDASKDIVNQIKEIQKSLESIKPKATTEFKSIPEILQDIQKLEGKLPAAAAPVAADAIAEIENKVKDLTQKIMNADGTHQEARDKLIKELIDKDKSPYGIFYALDHIMEMLKGYFKKNTEFEKIKEDIINAKDAIEAVNELNAELNTAIMPGSSKLKDAIILLATNSLKFGKTIENIPEFSENAKLREFVKKVNQLSTAASTVGSPAVTQAMTTEMLLKLVDPDIDENMDKLDEYIGKFYERLKSRKGTWRKIEDEIKDLAKARFDPELLTIRNEMSKIENKAEAKVQSMLVNANDILTKFTNFNTLTENIEENIRKHDANIVEMNKYRASIEEYKTQINAKIAGYEKQIDEFRKEIAGLSKPGKNSPKPSGASIDESKNAPKLPGTTATGASAMAAGTSASAPPAAEPATTDRDVTVPDPIPEILEAVLNLNQDAKPKPTSAGFGDLSEKLFLSHGVDSKHKPGINHTSHSEDFLFSERKGQKLETSSETEESETDQEPLPNVRCEQERGLSRSIPKPLLQNSFSDEDSNSYGEEEEEVDRNRSEEEDDRDGAESASYAFTREPEERSSREEDKNVDSTHAVIHEIISTLSQSNVRDHEILDELWLQLPAIDNLIYPTSQDFADVYDRQAHMLCMITRLYEGVSRGMMSVGRSSEDLYNDSEFLKHVMCHGRC